MCLGGGLKKIFKIASRRVLFLLWALKMSLCDRREVGAWSGALNAHRLHMTKHDGPKSTSGNRAYVRLRVSIKKMNIALTVWFKCSNWIQCIGLGGGGEGAKAECFHEEGLWLLAIVR